MDNIGIEYTIHKLKQESWDFLQAGIPEAWDVIWCKYFVFLFLLRARHKIIQIKLQLD